MKFLAKANKGALLSLGVLIVLVVYLVVVGVRQSEDQPALKAACEQYVSLAQEYSMLPDDYRDGSVLMSSTQQEQYLTELRTALTPLFDSESTSSLNITCNSFKQNLQPLFSGQTAVTSNQITITGYQDFTYSNNLVSVTFQYSVNSSGSSKTPQGGSKPLVGRRMNNTGVITFKKVGGDFKIVSVNMFNAVASPRMRGED